MRSVLICLPVVFFLIACSSDNEGTQLSSDEPAYEMSLILSEKLPVLHPDSNKVLISTSHFNITTADVMRLLESHLGNRLDQLKNRSAAQLKSIMHENASRYAEKKLLIRAAEAHGIDVKQASIDTFLQNQYSQWGGQEQYEKSLQNRNIAYDVMLTDVREGLLINQYFKQVIRPTIKVDPTMIDSIYNDYTATVRHILMLTQGKSEEEKATIRGKMEKLLERARNGEDFASLAMQYSEDPGSQKQGGIYKNFTRGQMVKNFEDASFSLDIGEISDIVETPYGYHIIKIIERNKHPQPYDVASALITETLQKQLQEKVTADHVQVLREQAKYEEFTL